MDTTQGELTLVAGTRYYLYRWSNHMLIETYTTLAYASAAARIMGYERIGYFEHVPVAYVAADFIDSLTGERKRVIVYNPLYQE